MATNGEVNFEGSPLDTPTLHITSHNGAGKAIIHTSEKPKATLYPEHRFASTNLYVTTAMPVDLNDDIDLKQSQNVISSGKLGVVQSKGTVIRYADFAPSSKGFIHRTQSLDYGIVMEGSIVLELDDGNTTLMSRGDIAIQRATMHGWHNPSGTEWARLLFVLQDCEPLVINGKSLDEDLGTAHGVVPRSGSG